MGCADPVGGPSIPETPDEVRVEKIEVNVQCNGPIEYRLLVSCRHCARKLSFIVFATLLASRELPCPNCGFRNRYRFRPGPHEPYHPRLDHYRRIEEAVVRKVTGSETGPLRQLGWNAMFPVLAHLSNGLR